MTQLAILFLALAILILAAGAFFFLRTNRPHAASNTEELLLREAVVVEAVAPGMQGRAEIRSGDSPKMRLKIRAVDASQAFVRGQAVRIIDVEGDTCIVESSDQEHLAR